MVKIAKIKHKIPERMGGKALAHKIAVRRYFSKKAREEAKALAKAEAVHDKAEENRSLKSQMRIDRQKQNNSRAKRVIMLAKKHPSARNVSVLQAIAQNEKLNNENRALAAEILLRWADPEFDAAIRKSRGPVNPGRKKAKSDNV